jgi:glycosyl transferase family 25
MFDHIYCINLDSRPDRWAECEAEFIKHGISNVERFVATTVNEIDSPAHIKPSEAALVRSHVRVLEDAKEKGYKKILILEDDIEFADTIHDHLDAVPENWEVLYFGGNHAWGIPYRMNDFLAVANKTLAMHCVGMTESAIDRMLGMINYNSPIDVTYAYALYLMNSYVFYPSQAWQRPSWSDLMGQHVDYGFLK